MIAILYAANKQLTPTHYRVIAWRGEVEHEIIWVRATLHKSGDVETAVALAKPRKCEIVLNAISLEKNAP